MIVNRLKFRNYSFLMIAILGAFIGIFEYLSCEKSNKAKSSGPKILLVVLGDKFWGGVQECAWDMYAHLNEFGMKINILLPGHFDSYLKAKNTNLKYHTFKSSDPDVFYKCLKEALIDFCNKDCPDIIHCNASNELEVVREVCDIFKIGMVAHYHNSIQPGLSKYRNMEGFIAVSPVSFSLVKKERK